MKTLVMTSLLGMLVASCSINSDPTKGTKYNFKNGSSLSEAPNIEQLSASECTRFFSVNIQNNYNFEPGQNLSEELTAYTKLKGLSSKLEIIPSESNPPGLAIKAIGDGHYQIQWDTSNVVFSNNYEIFEIELLHNISGKEQHQDFFDRCQIANRKKVRLTALKERRAIPIKIDNSELTEDSTQILDINANNKLEINLQSQEAKTHIVVKDLVSDDLGLNLKPYVTEHMQSNSTGKYIFEIDEELLSKEFKDEAGREIEFALNVNAVIEKVSDRSFVLKFKYLVPTPPPIKSPKEEEKAVNTSKPEPAEAPVKKPSAEEPPSSTQNDENNKDKDIINTNNTEGI